MKQQRPTEEAEAKRLATESARREEARIWKEIEEKELEEARALLAEAEKRMGKKGKKVAGDGVSFVVQIAQFLMNAQDFRPLACGCSAMSIDIITLSNCRR